MSNKYIKYEGQKVYGTLVTNDNIAEVTEALSVKKWVTGRNFKKYSTVDEFAFDLINTETDMRVDTTRQEVIDNLEEQISLLESCDVYNEDDCDYLKGLLSVLETQQVYLFNIKNDRYGIFWGEITDKRIQTDDPDLLY